MGILFGGVSTVKSMVVPLLSSYRPLHVPLFHFQPNIVDLAKQSHSIHMETLNMVIFMLLWITQNEWNSGYSRFCFIFALIWVSHTLNVIYHYLFFCLMIFTTNNFHLFLNFGQCLSKTIPKIQSLFMFWGGGEEEVENRQSERHARTHIEHMRRKRAERKIYMSTNRAVASNNI